MLKLLKLTKIIFLKGYKLFLKNKYTFIIKQEMYS